MTLSIQLNQLEHAQLVRSLDDQMMAYLFKHVLVQETTYATLLKNDRQRLHRLIAGTLERAEPERLNENAARLAQHFGEAGDDGKTLEYALRAGDYATRLHANAEAGEHFAHALTILNRRGGTADEYLRVYTRRGRALELAGEFQAALENYIALEQQGELQGDPSLELAGLLARATVYATPTSVHDVTLGAAYNTRALELARKLGDRRAECVTLWNLLLVSYFEDEPQAAVAYGKRALALARELGLSEQEAYILNDISRPMISVGPIANSLELLAAARVLFQAQNNLPMLADNLAATAATLHLAGSYAQGQAYTAQAIELSRRINSPWNLAYGGFGLMILNIELGNLDRVFAWSRELDSLAGAEYSLILIFGARAWRAEAHRILGDFERALEQNRKMAEWAQETYPQALRWLQANIVRTLVSMGELDQAAVLLANAYQGKNNDYSGFGPVLMRIADTELALAQYDPIRALRVSSELLADLERLDIEFERAAVYHLRGKAFMQQAAWADAVAAFGQARQYGERMPARRLLWETYAAWAQVEAQRGNHDGAAELHVQARAYIEYIAGHAGSPALRDSFLSQAHVRQELEISGAMSAS